MTIEEKAKAYAADKMCKALNLTFDCINRTDALIPKFCGRDLEEAYEDGYNEALKSQWVSVKDKLPENDSCFYFVADVKLDPLGVDCAEYTCETKKFSRYGKPLDPTHWMLIPPMKGGEV